MLLIHSCGEGPWVSVSRVKSVEIRGAGANDIIEIELDDRDLDSPPVVAQGNQTKFINFPEGKMRARNVSGKNPVTVIAHLERIGRKHAGNSPVERHPLFRHSLF
jgi:hypothetical protein